MKTASLALATARLLSIALIAITVPAPRGDDKNGVTASTSQAAESAPIILAQRCFNVNGQLRCF